jgi:hypothetical protein
VIVFVERNADELNDAIGVLACSSVSRTFGRCAQIVWRAGSDSAMNNHPRLEPTSRPCRGPSGSAQAASNHSHIWDGHQVFAGELNSDDVNIRTSSSVFHRCELDRVLTRGEIHMIRFGVIALSLLSATLVSLLLGASAKACVTPFPC